MHFMYQGAESSHRLVELWAFGASLPAYSGAGV